MEKMKWSQGVERRTFFFKVRTRGAQCKYQRRVSMERFVKSSGFGIHVMDFKGEIISMLQRQ